jgi:uroporphyrin-III C-methyltransferase/precorrin-2 dehydrogenase/sirohydrochlorin ferrochelatase
MAKLAEKYRALVKENINPPAQRRVFWEKILQGSIAELFYSGKEVEAEARLKDAIFNTPEQLDNTGEVYLVGAGPILLDQCFNFFTTATKNKGVSTF